MRMPVFPILSCASATNPRMSRPSTWAWTTMSRQRLSRRSLPPRRHRDLGHAGQRHKVPLRGPEGNAHDVGHVPRQAPRQTGRQSRSAGCRRSAC
jgi:hypothetical protein